MTTSTTTPAELAKIIGISPKSIRAWARNQGWRSDVEKNQPWQFTSEQVEAIRGRFAV